MRKPVITFQNTYVGGETTLCEKCESDPVIREALPSLGPVSHGQHYGTCDGCQK